MLLKLEILKPILLKRAHHQFHVIAFSLCLSYIQRHRGAFVSPIWYTSHSLITFRAKTAQNIENVKHDLKDTPTVDFVKMMKVFMYRGRLGEIESADLKGVTTAYLGQKKTIDADYNQILERAINFCNSDLTMPKQVVDRTSDQKLCQVIKRNMTK
jgi:hypothetical protein